jgi:glycosyltransferase involved in cell wall biosynthesis
MLDLTVIITTFRRPALLEGALRSCVSQTGVEAAFEILVIDNCPDRSASPVVARVSDENPGRIRYVSEPAAGISHARTAGVRAARGDLIVFLDDDNEADPTWLASLLRVQRQHDADAVFGPVRARLAFRPRLHQEFFQRYFSRDLDMPDGAEISDRYSYLGTGNSLFRRSTCFGGRLAPFAANMGLVGGEDTLLLKQLVLDGRRFFWAAEAVVYEHVEAQRLRVAYVCKRRFRSGQIRSETCLMVKQPQRLELVRWMSVGLVQFVGWGLVAAVLGPSRSRLAVRAAAAASGGLGKVVWMKPFQLALYGKRVSPAPEAGSAGTVPAA